MTASWRNFSDVDDAMAFAHGRGLLDSRTGDKIMRLRMAGHDDPEIDELIVERARHELYCERMGVNNPFRPVPSPAPVGPIFAGCDVRTGLQVRLTPAALRRHLLLIARTGAGKSVLVVNLLMSLLVARDIRGIWLMDAYKRELRRVLPLFRRVGRPFAVLTPRTTPFNLLQVPSGHVPHEHASVVCDVLSSTFALPEGATRLLHQSVHALYIKHGVAQGQSAAYPTLYDLFEHVRKDDQANIASKDALLDRLRELLLALTPKAAAWRIGWTPADLAKRSILWELGGSGESAKHYLLDAFVNGALRDQLLVPCPSEWPRTVMFLDDAQRLVSARTSGRMSPLAEVLLVCRSAGTSIILGHQSTEGVERLILSQLGTRFVGQLGLASDWMWARQELGLTSAQIDYCRHQMNPGMFVVHAATAESGARYPHLIQVPNIHWPTVTDDKVEASRGCLADLPLVAAPEFERWEPWPVTRVPYEPAASGPTPVNPDDEGNVIDLDAAELAFLRAIVDHPGIASSELPHLAGLSPRRALEIRERLVRDGYLRLHRVSTAARGRRSLVLEPLEPALRALGVAPEKEVRA